MAFGIKAAAFPVNTWLPAAYHTPPAAISALMGGLLTKVGVYALLRTMVMLLPASREVLAPALAMAAMLTLVLAPMGAIAETNLRRAIGFLLIGGIGSTLLGIAVSGETALAGSAVYVLHAMLTITALYLVAGLIEKATGQTDTRRMGGLYAASSPLSPSSCFLCSPSAACRLRSASGPSCCCSKAASMRPAWAPRRHSTSGRWGWP